MKKEEKKERAEQEKEEKERQQRATEQEMVLSEKEQEMVLSEKEQLRIHLEKMEEGNVDCSASESDSEGSLDSVVEDTGSKEEVKELSDLDQVIYADCA